MATRYKILSAKDIDSDLSSVSANDDTVPSAKATKAALDLKIPIAGGETSGKILKSNGTNWVASTETYAAPGTSGNVLTSDGTNWTSAAPSGGTSTYTFIMAGSCYSNGVFSYNAQGWNIFPAFALPDDSTKSFIGSTTTPAGKTGISAIRAYYIGAGVNAGNIVCEFSTGKIDPDTAGNTLTADNTTTATTITGTQNGIGFLDFPADSFNAMGTIAEPDIIGVRVDRIGGNGGDTYSSSIDMIGFRITWS